MRTPEDDKLRALCSFDVVGAMNKLSHYARESADPKLATAAREAEVSLLHYRSMLGPERLSEIEYADVLQDLMGPLDRFIAVARQREADEIAFERHIYGSRPKPRPFQVTGAALRAASSLRRAVTWLAQRWVFDSKGRTLPGTARARGQRPKRLLAEVEMILAAHGMSQREIARLDLDGQTTTDLDAAEQRVRKRIANERRLRAEEREEDPLAKAIESIEPPND